MFTQAAFFSPPTHIHTCIRIYARTRAHTQEGNDGDLEVTDIATAPTIEQNEAKKQRRRLSVAPHIVGDITKAARLHEQQQAKDTQSDENYGLSEVEGRCV